MTRAGTSGRRPAVSLAPMADLTPLEGACRLLERACSVVLLAHINPDADALGSALALGMALEGRGAEVTVDVAGLGRLTNRVAVDQEVIRANVR